MAEKDKMKKPESGGKPKRITTDAPPGGRYTPGAKAKLKRSENRQGKLTK